MSKIIDLEVTDFLVDIPWETRNLGVQSFALAENFLDSPDEKTLRRDVSSKVKEFEKIFVQARIGKADFNIGRILENLGFYFVEATLTPYTVFKKNSALQRFVSNKEEFTPPRYNLSDLNVTILNKNDKVLCQAIREIANSSFPNDRFHLDPNCSNDIAGRRVSYWIDDLLNDDAVTFNILELHDKVIAFMARKENNLILAGFAKQYINSGLGDFFWLSVIENMMEQDLNQANTMISANNTPVLNLYCRIGFKFKDPAVTFHYWSR